LRKLEAGGELNSLSNPLAIIRGKRIVAERMIRMGEGEECITLSF